MFTLLNLDLAEKKGVAGIITVNGINHVMVAAIRLSEGFFPDSSITSLRKMAQSYPAGNDFADRVVGLENTTSMVSRQVRVEMSTLIELYTRFGGYDQGIAPSQRLLAFSKALDVMKDLPYPYISRQLWDEMKEEKRNPFWITYALGIIRAVNDNGVVPRTYIQEAYHIRNWHPRLWKFVTDIVWESYTDQVPTEAKAVHWTVKDDCSTFWKEFRAVGGALIVGDPANPINPEDLTEKVYAALDRLGL